MKEWLGNGIVRYVDADTGAVLAIETFTPTPAEPAHNASTGSSLTAYRCQACGVRLTVVPGPVYCPCGGAYFERIA